MRGGGAVLTMYYEGTDITDYVNITKCVHRDASCGQADLLDMELDNAATWYQWGPKADDEIIVTRDGYSTGKLYLNSLRPEGDHFRLIASSMPTGAKRQAWAGYTNETLESIAHLMATECGMTEQLYGIDGELRYGFLLRRWEGCAAFLDRIGQWEGLAIKAVNGRFRAVSVAWAQEREPERTLWLDTSTEGVTYLCQRENRWAGLMIFAPGIEVAAKDSRVESGYQKPIALPARSEAEAGRWARGLLMMNNRKAERLTVKTEFDPTMTALNRMDVEGTEAISGQWIVDSVQHDMKNGATEAEMLRCIHSIE